MLTTDSTMATIPTTFGSSDLTTDQAAKIQEAMAAVKKLMLRAITDDEVMFVKLSIPINNKQQGRRSFGPIRKIIETQ